MTNHTPLRKHHCNKCGDLFIPAPSKLARGNLICKVCRSIGDKKWRLRRKAEGNPVISANMPYEWQKEYNKKYYSDSENKKKAAARQRKYTNNPILRPRYEARWMTRRAIASGKLIRQPCEVCQLTKSEAHHDDYTKPFDIRWLCKKHHNEWHAKAGVK